MNKRFTIEIQLAAHLKRVFRVNTADSAGISDDGRNVASNFLAYLVLQAREHSARNPPVEPILDRMTGLARSHLSTSTSTLLRAIDGETRRREKGHLEQPHEKKK